jgi:hypothetical protein
MDKTYTQADKEAQAKFGYDKALMEIQKSSNIEVAGIEAKYRNLTQASSSAASLSNVASGNANAILLNDKITGDSTQPDPANPGKFLSNKQVAIDQVMGNYQNSLKLIGAMAGDVDLMSFMDQALGGATPTPTPADIASPEAAQRVTHGNEPAPVTNVPPPGLIGTQLIPEEAGFTPPPEGSTNTQAMVTYKNTKTGKTVTVPNGGYKAPSADWAEV